MDLLYTILLVTGLIFYCYRLFMTLKSEKRLKALRLSNVDNMTGLAFEKYTAWLLSKNGFTDIRVTRGSGDYGADIIAKHKDFGYTCIQCKRFSKNVGIKAVQEIYSAKQYYGCNTAIVLTNMYFTKQAAEMAQRCNVILWSRTILADMILNVKNNLNT